MRHVWEVRGNLSGCIRWTPRFRRGWRLEINLWCFRLAERPATRCCCRWVEVLDHFAVRWDRSW